MAPTTSTSTFTLLSLADSPLCGAVSGWSLMVAFEAVMPAGSSIEAVLTSGQVSAILNRAHGVQAANPSFYAGGGGASL